MRCLVNAGLDYKIRDVRRFRAFSAEEETLLLTAGFAVRVQYGELLFVPRKCGTHGFTENAWSESARFSFLCITCWTFWHERHGLSHALLRSVSCTHSQVTHFSAALCHELSYSLIRFVVWFTASRSLALNIAFPHIRSGTIRLLESRVAAARRNTSTTSRMRQLPNFNSEPKRSVDSNKPAA